MNKNRLWILVLLILLITPHTITGFSSEDEATESSINEMLYPLNPRYYYDVKILMMSRMYESIEIDGFHNYNYGNGHDDNIALRDSNRIYTIGILIIWDDSEIKEFSLHGGWVHTRIEIFDYDGWMSGQDKTTILNMIPLKIYGHCDEIKITAYRG